MALASGSRASLALIKETSFGVTPGTPTFSYLPINTHSLDLTKDRVEGNEIQSDRMTRVDRHGNRQAGGSIEVDLRKGDFDGLLESVMMGAFDTTGDDNDILKVGTTQSFYTIEDHQADITQFRLFTGMSASSMNLSIAPNQMISTSFDMVGKDMTMATSSASTGAAGVITPSSTNSPFDSYTGTISLAGTTSTIVTSLDLSISNSFAPTFVVGSANAQSLEFGRAVVEGTITVYYQDQTAINRFLNETKDTAITVSVNAPGATDTYVFKIPNVKYNGASVPLQNPQSRLVTLPFIGLFDDTLSTNLQIERPSS
jgi:hypothetical protein